MGRPSSRGPRRASRVVSGMLTVLLTLLSGTRVNPSYVAVP